SLGCPTLDLDLVAREVTRPGQPVLDVIADRLGTALISPEGELDRAALAHLIFRDGTARACLDEILHPAILDVAEQWVQGQANRPSPSPVVMLEVPLLFEAGLEKSVDRIVLVTAEPEGRVARLVNERGMAHADAMARISAQQPDSVKRDRSHYVIENDGSLEELEPQVRSVWGHLLKDAGA
nr:dephospho-CoA kinase [Armatimonadota bacterium]